VEWCHNVNATRLCAIHHGNALHGSLMQFGYVNILWFVKSQDLM
jgi:hypothetical protein